MVLVDFNGIFILHLMKSLSADPTASIEPDYVRPIILNSLVRINQKFRHEFGEMVICCDDNSSWRKKFFKHYKGNRKKQRKKSKYDWRLIFDVLETLRDEFKENLPYKLVLASWAEADDVIAVLCKQSQEKFIKQGLVQTLEKVLIVSSDKDFIQLQNYSNVQQYSPYHKEFLTHDDPKTYLKEHIIRGDATDGIPNMLSQDNVFMCDELRQKTIWTKKLEVWIEQHPVNFCLEIAQEWCSKDKDLDEEKEHNRLLKNWKRNKILIDLNSIPRSIEKAIFESFQEEPKGKKAKMHMYLGQHGLNKLMDKIGDF